MIKCDVLDCNEDGHARARLCHKHGIELCKWIGTSNRWRDSGAALRERNQALYDAAMIKLAGLQKTLDTVYSPPTDCPPGHTWVGYCETCAEVGLTQPPC